MGSTLVCRRAQVGTQWSGVMRSPINFLDTQLTEEELDAPPF